MSSLFPDTHPDAEAVLIRLLCEAPSWRKLEMVGQMNAAVKTMMLSGLRERYPKDSASLLRDEWLIYSWEQSWPPRFMDPSARMKMLAEPLAVTLLVVEVFEKLDIPYLIGGSLASALHGTARTGIGATF